MSDILKNLAIDTWYKALLYAGFFGLVAALFWEIRGISNLQLLLISGGSFLFGLGEWKNQKVESWIKEANAYTGPPAIITRHYRERTLLGTLFQFLGGISFIIGLVSIFYGAILRI